MQLKQTKMRSIESVDFVRSDAVDSQNNFQRFQTFAASESTRNKTALLLCGVCRGEHDADCSFKMLKLVPPFRPSHRTANDVASSDDNADDDDAYAYGSVVDFEMDVEALVPQHVAPARVGSFVDDVELAMIRAADVRAFQSDLFVSAPALPRVRPVAPQSTIDNRLDAVVRRFLVRLCICIGR